MVAIGSAPRELICADSRRGELRVVLVSSEETTTYHPTCYMTKNRILHDSHYG